MITKVLKVSSLITILFVIQGCMTTSTIRNAHKLRDHTILQDSVVAIGRSNTPTTNNEAVIVGLKHSYLLTKGGQEVFEISNSLDSTCINVNLESYTIDGKTYVGESPIRLRATSEGFAGLIQITYMRIYTNYSPAELAVLNRIGFVEEKGPAAFFIFGEKRQFTKTISLEGQIYQPVTNLAEVKTKFNKERTLIITGDAVPNNNSKSLFYKVVELPLAVALDTLIFPLSAPVAALLAIDEMKAN